jgi:hypothetical protein
MGDSMCDADGDTAADELLSFRKPDGVTIIAMKLATNHCRLDAVLCKLWQDVRTPCKIVFEWRLIENRALIGFVSWLHSPFRGMHRGGIVPQHIYWLQLFGGAARKTIGIEASGSTAN